ncbi:MAG: DNA polymerase III subunit beta [Candidatus Falkowbacteria bacterium]
MKVILLQKNFKQGVFATSYITGKNNNLPILNNLLIQAKAGVIKLISTDLEMGITSTVRGKIEEDGSLTVNAKVLANYINLLPNKKIDIAQDGQNLSLECDNYKTKINGDLADDYPLIPEVSCDQVYKVNINDFKEAVASVLFAVSADDSRPAFTGVLLTIEGRVVTMVGTDSYRLAERKLELAEGASDELKRVILPLKTLQELNRIISGDYSDEHENNLLKIVLNENQVLFTFDNIEIVSRLIDEKYPDYKQIIPTGCKTEMILDREEFARAVKTSAIFSKSGVNDVILDFKADAGQMVISSASGQTGQNEAGLNGKLEGSDNSVTINYRYLLDGLSNIKSSSVKWQMIDCNTPCLLKPADNDNYVYIIMPIKR